MLEPFQIIKSEWKNINLGIQKAKHDYHSFVFSTISKNSPESRTVILRDFDEHKPAISQQYGFILTEGVKRYYTWRRMKTFLLCFTTSPGRFN